MVEVGEHWRRPMPGGVVAHRAQAVERIVEYVERDALMAATDQPGAQPGVARAEVQDAHPSVSRSSGWSTWFRNTSYEWARMRQIRARRPLRSR